VGTAEGFLRAGSIDDAIFFVVRSLLSLIGTIVAETEALINFSNHAIYQGRLVTFPGPGGSPVIGHELVQQETGVDGQEESRPQRSGRWWISLSDTLASARARRSV